MRFALSKNQNKKIEIIFSGSKARMIQEFTPVKRQGFVKNATVKEYCNNLYYYSIISGFLF